MIEGFARRGVGSPGRSDARCRSALGTRRVERAASAQPRRRREVRLSTTARRRLPCRRPRRSRRSRSASASRGPPRRRDERRRAGHRRTGARSTGGGTLPDSTRFFRATALSVAARIPVIFDGGMVRARIRRGRACTVASALTCRRRADGCAGLDVRGSPRWTARGAPGRCVVGPSRVARGSRGEEVERAPRRARRRRVSRQGWHPRRAGGRAARRGAAVFSGSGDGDEARSRRVERGLPRREQCRAAGAPPTRSCGSIASVGVVHAGRVIERAARVPFSRGQGGALRQVEAARLSRGQRVPQTGVDVHDVEARSAGFRKSCYTH